MQTFRRFRTIAAVLTASAICAPTPAQTPDSSRSEARSTREWGPTIPGSALDTRDSIAYLREAIVLAHLRDSLRAALQKPRTVDSVPDDRPGRAYLRTVDSTLFSSHSGSVGNEYPLGPGDVLVLSIWGQKQARYELEIDRDGQVQIPSVGVVSLNGVTFKEAKAVLARRLSSAYSGIHSGLTQIDLTLQKLKQVRVFVVGDVAHPGGYVLSGTSSSLQAVAIAGGPTTRGSERTVKIVRGDVTHDVDLYSYLFLGRRPQRDILQDGDVVRVLPALGTARVEGAVARPGRYEVQPGESAADLFELAGGISPDGDPDLPVRLLRATEGNTNTSLLGSAKDLDRSGRNVAIFPGDAMVVERRKPARRGSPVVTGFVRNPGTFPYDPSLTVRKLVSMAGGGARGAVLSRVLLFRFDSLGGSSLLVASAETGPDVPVLPSDSVHIPGQELSDSAVRVQISGAVRAPGVYEWTRGMRLRDLVLLAGGTQPWADRRSIRIDERAPRGTEVRSRVVSLDTSGADLSDPALAAYAIVSVPSREHPVLPPRVELTGHVRTPGTLALASTGERISSAIRRAGGLDSDAYPEGALVWRRSEGRIPSNLSSALSRPGGSDDIVLQDGDSIHVPLRPATVSVSGMVNRPTRVLWRKGKDWSWYVRAAGDFSDSANSEAVYVQYADGSIQSRSQGPDEPTPGSSVVVPRKEPIHPSTVTEKISAFSTVVTALATIATVYVLYVTSRK